MLLLAVVLAGLLAGPVRADAAPAPSPAPSSPAGDGGCSAKAPGSVAWCMPWAVHVDTPAAPGGSHWVTECSRAISDVDRRSCAAASITVDSTPRDGTASVLMDGPSTGSGPAGLINCALQAAPGGYNPNPAQRAAWDAKKAACQEHVAAWSAQLYDPDPKQPDCPVTDISCKVERGAQDALSAGISSGMQGLVDIVVQGTVFLLSKLATWVFAATAISSPDDAFYSTYNSVAGILVVLIFVFFIVSTIINGLRTSAGPSPVSTLGGLVRAVLGITFAGGIAYTIVAAWDQATDALILANARTPYDPSILVTTFTDLTDGVGTLFIALLLSLLATIGLVLLFVIMLFRGLLATGAALFGAMAMTGQVMPETRHWGRRWFWTVNALGSSKLFIAALWIYGSRAAYGSDSVMNALRGVLIIWLMVVAPFILLRLTTMWDGYLSDVNGHALLSVAGNPLMLGASFLQGLGRGAAGAGGSGAGGSGAGGAGGSPASAAAGLMNGNTANVPTTPGAQPGTAAGTGGGGKSQQAAQAAATGADGGAVGEPATDPGAEQGQTAADKPNTQETDGIKTGSASAHHDLAAGKLTAPGDAISSAGSLPVTPAGARDADPAGADPQGGNDAGGAGPADAPTTPDHDRGAPEPTGPTGGGASPGGGSGAAAVAADVPVIPI